MQTALKLYNFEIRRRNQEAMQIRVAVQFQKQCKWIPKAAQGARTITQRENAVQKDWNSKYGRREFPISLSAFCFTFFISLANWIWFWAKSKCRIRVFLPSISMRRLHSLARSGLTSPLARHSDLELMCHPIEYSAIKSPFNAWLRAENTKTRTPICPNNWAGHALLWPLNRKLEHSCADPTLAPHRHTHTHVQQQMLPNATAASFEMHFIWAHHSYALLPRSLFSPIA